MAYVSKVSSEPISGKMLSLPLGLLLFSVLIMVVLFLAGDKLFSAISLKQIGLAIGLLTLIASGWIAYLMLRFYKQQHAWQEAEARQQESIVRLLDEMSTLAEGDLTIRASVSEDITGAVADSVNYAVEALRDLVIKIDDTSGRLNRFAQVADKRISQLSQSSAKQSEEVSMASSAIVAMTHSIHRVSQNAAASTEVARKSLEISQAGAQTVRSAIADMVAIREQIQATSKRIKRQGETSQEVGDIVRLMNDIAEQTNILALNASIQISGAADGGGRSFERVTDEVQQLAQRSAEATRKIDILVRAIQTDTQEAISSMEQTTAKVVTSSRNAESAGAALDEVENVSSSLARLIANISDASFKQAEMANRVTKTMKSIQDLTSNTTQYSKEATDLVFNLKETATELRRSIADFTLSKRDAD
ncbi:methyl-accepting chemotaxis protein [Thiolinea disciformis]|uniref:methyl-accepting chemotaxis protein n=1 Tax=Thiolinea disciformis TaxID=125614 RepID=UPI00037C31E3|nr:methyl-accepting chemotaxis protein [Thiolinea disciformis]